MPRKAASKTAAETMPAGKTGVTQQISARIEHETVGNVFPPLRIIPAAAVLDVEQPAGHPGEGDLAGLLVLRDDLHPELGGRLLQDALRGLALLEDLLDRRLGPDADLDAGSQQQLQLVDHQSDQVGDLIVRLGANFFLGAGSLGVGRAPGIDFFNRFGIQRRIVETFRPGGCLGCSNAWDCPCGPKPIPVR